MNIPSDDEMRVMVAELCGMIIPSHCVTKRMMAGEKKNRLFGAPADFAMRGSEPCHLPNYPEDLNACASFEQTMTDEEKINYADLLIIAVTLSFSTQNFDLCHATARQRCVAFLMTKGKIK